MKDAKYLIVKGEEYKSRGRVMVLQELGRMTTESPVNLVSLSTSIRCLSVSGALCFSSCRKREGRTLPSRVCAKGGRREDEPLQT